MPTFKNIRIKMKDGKTRLQRVKVLKSGKFKFVKNLTRKRRSTSAKTTKTKKRKNNPKRGNVRVARGKSPKQTIWKVARVGAALAPAIAGIFQFPGDPKNQAGVTMARYFGFDPLHPEAGIQLNRLVEGYGPSVMVVVAQKAEAFISRLIRSF